jgi:hypothetical protein
MTYVVRATEALAATNSKGQPLAGQRDLRFERTGIFNRFIVLAGEDGEEHIAVAATAEDDE